MLKIVLNGENHTVSNDCTAAQLIESLDLGAINLALEINGEIIPRSDYPRTGVNAGDKVEIIHAVGGG